MEVLQKNGLLVVALLVGGLVLYEFLKKPTGRTGGYSYPAGHPTQPNTGNSVAGIMTASTNAFASLYSLFGGGGSQPGQDVSAPSWLNDSSIFQDTTGNPGGSSGGMAYGPFPAAIGVDPGTGFDTGGSMSDANWNPSTMDMSGVNGDSGASFDFGMF